MASFATTSARTLAPAVKSSGAHFPPHTISDAREHASFGMAEINGEINAARHRIGRAWQHLEGADRKTQRIGLIPCQHLERTRELYGCDKRIAPFAHRRRAGMGLFAFDLNLKDPEALNPGYDPDLAVAVFQLRTLFDMRFDIGEGRFVQSAAASAGSILT